MWFHENWSFKPCIFRIILNEINSGNLDKILQELMNMEGQTLCENFQTIIVNDIHKKAYDECHLSMTSFTNFYHMYIIEILWKTTAVPEAFGLLATYHPNHLFCQSHLWSPSLFCLILFCRVYASDTEYHNIRGSIWLNMKKIYWT